MTKERRFWVLVSILSFLLLDISMLAQEEAAEEYSFMLQPSCKGSLLLRGKAFGGVFIEDHYLGNITLGLEYRIGEHHSFGVDAIAMKHWIERDLWDPVTGEELGHGHFGMDSRLYILMDYRLYIHPLFAQENQFSLYINPYHRIGWGRLWKDNEFIFEKNDVITGSDQYLDYGFNIGIRTGAVQTHIFGFDASIGIMNRIKIENHILYIDSETIQVINDRTTEFLMPSLRTNLYFYLFRKRH